MFAFVAVMLFSQQPVTPVMEGVASYYTVASSSGWTASGERMRDDAYTCAMREGEFGTYYRITSDTGHSVICRLNDRGPYVKGRIIDLSEAAIRELHPTAGLLRVSVEMVPDGAVPPQFR